MRKFTCLFLLSLFSFSLLAADKDSTIYYQLDDSVKVIQFLAGIKINSVTGKREVTAGIKTDVVQLYFEADKNEKEIVFAFPANAIVLTTGSGVETEKGELEWEHEWSLDKTYKLMIAVAADSAENFSLYSGYVWLPDSSKWKLIGTCRVGGQSNTIRQPAAFFTSSRKAAVDITTDEIRFQRTNGSWKNLREREGGAAAVNLFLHLDSVQQRAMEEQLIRTAIGNGKTDATIFQEGVYYKIVTEGAGPKVTVEDTVVAFYKGYLFSDGTVFDQTKDKPATFPLKRLIKGWQIAVPNCRVGGKIRIVIPSDLAYSIRTRAAKIPPNSILVFEIEIVETKPPVK